jgi:hypothetical protein
VTERIVETSNVGVKIGMVGRDVKDAVGVVEGMEVCVEVGNEDEVVVSRTGTDVS